MRAALRWRAGLAGAVKRNTAGAWSTTDTKVTRKFSGGKRQEIPATEGEEEKKRIKCGGSRRRGGGTAVRDHGLVLGIVLGLELEVMSIAADRVGHTMLR